MLGDAAVVSRGRSGPGSGALLGGRAGLVAAATLAAIAVGYVAARDPAFLHFQPTVRGTALLGAALALGAALVWRPGAALVALVLVVYLNLSDVLIRWHGAPSLLQALALPLGLAAWVAHRRQPDPAPPPVLLTLGLAAYPLVLWLSSVWAREPALADARAVALGKAFVIYALVLLLAASRARLRLGVWSVVATATLVAALGIYQAVSGAYGQTFGGLARVEFAQIYGEVIEPRIAGPVGDPNFFAQLLIPAVPLALALAQGTANVRWRVGALGCAAIVTAAVVLTYSRGGALALGGVLALWLLGRGLSGRRLALGAAVVAALLVLLPADFTQRLTTFRQLLPGGGGGEVLRLDSSFENRRVLATAAWYMFLDRPLTGVGAGNYTVHFRAYADETGSATLEYEEFDAAHYPHNLYLEVAAETGWPGLVVFGTVLAAACVALGGARRRLRRAGDGAQAALATGVLLALVGYLGSSLFLHGHYPRYLWLLFGLAAALHRVAFESHSPLAAADPSGPGGATAGRSDEVPS